MEQQNNGPKEISLKKTLRNLLIINVLPVIGWKLGLISIDAMIWAYALVGIAFASILSYFIIRNLRNRFRENKLRRPSDLQKDNFKRMPRESGDDKQ